MLKRFAIGTIDESGEFNADTIGNDPELTTFDTEAEARAEIQRCMEVWPSLFSGAQLIGAAILEDDSEDGPARIVWSETLSELWDRLSSPIERVVDEDGVNVANAMVRQAGAYDYVYVDDDSGYSLMNQSEYDLLDDLVHEEAR